MKKHTATVITQASVQKRGMVAWSGQKPNSMRKTVDKYENIETVKRLDFDRLDTVVSERIGALKLLAQGMTERQVNDDICRDLILPCVYTLAQFIEAVQIEEKNT